MQHFDALKIYSCGKHCEKRRYCLEQAISPFLTMLSTLYSTYFHLKCTLKCYLQFVSIWTSLKFCHLVIWLIGFFIRPEHFSLVCSTLYVTKKPSGFQQSEASAYKLNEYAPKMMALNEFRVLKLA